MSEQRKVVTILFADVVGSTELATEHDPEVIRAMMSRYFKRIGEISAAYGGTIEKFAGDAAMVVFGVPTVHDDDAERAVRAALEIRDGATEISVRVGVNTGEAVTAVTDDRQFMVSGDAVNIAARLQQGAETGEVIVGPLTYQMTRQVIEYESRQPVAAKGKVEPLAAHRALRARSEVPVQARGVPGLEAALVGRNRELSLLIDTYARAVEYRSCHLFTLVGAAGIGKSRLVGEALERLAATGARVLRGRCLPYGRGITYWPFIEMLQQDTGIELADERATALRKLDRWLGELLGHDPQRPAVSARLAVMLGFDTAETAMPDTPGDRVKRELAWAARHYIEAVAAAAPLIVVVDDMQWAEPPVLSLIDELAERAVDVRMLVICVARPEFLESHAGWGTGKPNATTITLDPLNPGETATLVSRLLEIERLPEELSRKIVERSAGTPLFCEELIHMLIDEGLLVREGTSWRATRVVDEIRVPQGINAVIAARLDLLPERERTVLQAASVVGERFGPRDLQALLGAAEAEIDLEALRRKGLIAGGDGPDQEFRFRHLLIRDAAYSSLTKSQRAVFHDRFRALLETASGDPQQITEIIAFHAERAFTLSHELGLEQPVLLERASHAIRWLLATADRARMRHDIGTMAEIAATLRLVATVLPRAEETAMKARLKLLDAQLRFIRADYSGARDAAIESAALGDEADLLEIVATARLTEAWIWNFSGEGLNAEFEVLVERAIEATKRAGDERGEIEARQIGTNILYSSGRLQEFVEINLQLLARARSIGDAARAASILERLAATEGLRGNQDASDSYMADGGAIAARLGLRNIALNLERTRASSLMRAGDFAGAEIVCRGFVAAAEESGAVQQRVSALRFLAYSLERQRRYAEAAEALDEAIEISEESGERWNRAEVLALRARMAVELGQISAADDLIGRALSVARPEDVTGIAETYSHLGVIRAAQGRLGEAESALRHGLDAVAGTDYMWPHGNAIVDLARFLALHARASEARILIDDYAEKAHAKGWRMWDRDILQIQQLEANSALPDT